MLSNRRPLIDPLREWVLGEGWQLLNNFIKDIEYENNCEGQFPITALLSSQNLAIKWLNFALRN